MIGSKIYTMKKKQSKSTETKTLSVVFSEQRNDKWVNNRVGSAWLSEDGRRLDIKLNMLPTNLPNGRLKVWMEPFEED